MMSVTPRNYMFTSLLFLVQDYFGLNIKLKNSGVIFGRGGEWGHFPGKWEESHIS